MDSDASALHHHVAQWLNYDPETGAFTWLKSRGGRLAGSKAGHVQSFDHGRSYYLCIRFDGRLWKATHLAWVLMTGTLPAEIVDHKNGDTLDDRWDNLREATASQNMHNAKRRKDNNSGCKGVSWCKWTNKWVARIRQPQGKYLNLGRFANRDHAKSAYDAAAARLFGEFARAG